MRDKCWVCLRITPAYVLKQAHIVWSENPKIARKIGLEASKIIEKAYHKNRFFFCGKRGRSLLSGLFYLLGARHKFPLTHEEIGNALNITFTTVMRYKTEWIKTFPDLFKDFHVSQRTVHNYRWGDVVQWIVVHKTKQIRS